MPTKKKRQTGKGFFGDVWSGLKKGFNIVKDNKLLSRGLGLIPHPNAQMIAGLAKQAGLGRKRKRRVQRGSGASHI